MAVHHTLFNYGMPKLHGIPVTRNKKRRKNLKKIRLENDVFICD